MSEYQQNFQFDKWYPHLSKMSIKSHIVPLPDSFIKNFILRDFVCQPEEIFKIGQDGSDEQINQINSNQNENEK